MKKPPLLPLFLLVLVGFAAWLAYDARTTNQGERPFALLEQAREQRAAGNLPLAHAMLNRALEQAPGEALALEILHERADLCEASGAFQLAMNDYQRIAAAQPDDLVLQQKIAGLYRSMGAIDSANQVWLDLPAGDWSPNSVAATASPPPSPGYQASSTASSASRVRSPPVRPCSSGVLPPPAP